MTISNIPAVSGDALYRSNMGVDLNLIDHIRDLIAMFVKRNASTHWPPFWTYTEILQYNDTHTALGKSANLFTAAQAQNAMDAAKSGIR